VLRLRHVRGAMTKPALFALLAISVAGCEHKSQRDDNAGWSNSTAGSGLAKPAASGDLKPEPVNKEPEPPKPLPAPSQDLRAPTPEDLALYSKDLPGTGDKLIATIETSLGTLHCELYGDKAPMGVANFIGLATGKKTWLDPKSGELRQGKPYFDGTQCHRVIAEFMMQCGDPTATGMGGPGYKFGVELANDLKMDPGTLAYANAGPDTNGSQFFVMEGSRPDLVGHYTIFGKCKELDVVKKVTHTPVDVEKPKTPVVLQKVTISKG
jgi:cyclophilin family peptidyl-prolyl cis-trans isomerase